MISGDSISWKEDRENINGLLIGEYNMFGGLSDDFVSGKPIKKFYPDMKFCDE